LKNVTLNLLLELVIAVFLVIVIVIVNYPTLAVGSGKSQRVAAVSVTVSHTVGQQYSRYRGTQYSPRYCQPTPHAVTPCSTTSKSSLTVGTAEHNDKQQQQQQ